MAKKKTKKKVTAPLTYDPGKGRPKEHLAYLNWQEMQALKRLNGNNQERGPKGLPSFPPADSRSGAYNSGYGSAAPKSSPSTTSRNPTGGSLSAPARTQPSSAPSRPSGSGFSGISGGGARDSGQAANPTSRPAGSGFAGVSGGTSRGVPTSRGPAASMAASKDSAAKQAVAREAARVARESPAYKADVSKKASGISVSAGEKNSSAGIGGRISGALKSVQETAQQAALRRMGPIGPTPNQYKTAIDMERAMLTDLKRNKIDPAGRNKVIKTIEQLGKVGKMVQGEAAFEDPFGQAAVAKTAFNRIDAFNEDPERFKYMGGDDFDNLMAGYDATGMRPATKNKVTGSYLAAVPGTPEYRKGIIALNQALGPESNFNKTASKTVKNATHYYNPAEASPNWDNIDSFETVGSHKFGNAERIGRSVAAARMTADASVNPAGFSASDRPRVALSPSPVSNEGGVSIRSDNQNMQRPTVQTLMSGGKKQINDRLVSFNGGTYEIGPDRLSSMNPEAREGWENYLRDYSNPPTFKRDAASTTVVTDPRASMNPGDNRFGREKLFSDRISASVPSATDGPFGGRPIPRTPVPASMRSATDIASRLPAAARTPTPTSLRGATQVASGLPLGVRTPTPANLRSATQIASRLPAAVRTPSPVDFRSATQIAAALPAGVRTPGPEGMRSATDIAANIPPGARMPTPASVRSATQAAANIPIPAAPSYSPIPEPDSIGLMPSTADAANIGGYIGAAISGVRALPSAMAAINDAASLAGKAISQYSTATTGVLGLMGGKSIANAAVSDAAKQAIDAGAQRVAALQESWRNAVEDAKRVDPSIQDSETEDIANGLATVGLAEGYKLGEGKILEKTRGLPAPSRPIPGMSRVSNIFATNPRTLATDLRDMVNEGYGKFSNASESVDDSAFANSLTGDEAAEAAKAAGFPRNVYTNPDFLNDPTQQGIMRGPVTPDPTEMAKLVQRSFADNIAPKKYGDDDVEGYRTSAEKTRTVVSNIVEKVVSFGAPARLASGVAKKLMSIESPERFLSRPLYEQKALYEYAREASGGGGGGGRRRDNTGVNAIQQPGTGPTGNFSGLDSRGDGIGTNVGSGGSGGASSGGTGGDSGSPSQDGRRPDIYYKWDLGVNIPSPGDPLYTMYMTYLAERNAASAAMYG